MIAYWAIGFAFAFGDPSNSVIGYGYFFSIKMPANLYPNWFFQFVFAATASTIVSGALAERVHFKGFLVYSVVLTGITYPVTTHWAWAENGWLKNLGGKNFGFRDFAGSGVVHLHGGVASFVGALLLGPRIGRFPKKGDEPKMEIRGHSTPVNS